MTADIVIGKPICEPWLMFCNVQSEWNEQNKNNTVFTNERFLPKIMTEVGMVKSIGEVRRNKPELVKTLDEPDFLEIKWGKSRLFIQVGI